MGMYTEFHFNTELKKDTPQSVIDILSFMVGDKKKEPNKPVHEFFECARWKYLFTMDSYYFSADTYSTLRYDDISESYFLCVRSNLKDYDNEIVKFLDFISEYIEDDEEFLGFYRYEEEKKPTLIYSELI